MNTSISIFPTTRKTVTRCVEKAKRVTWNSPKGTFEYSAIDNRIVTPFPILAVLRINYMYYELEISMMLDFGVLKNPTIHGEASKFTSGIFMEDSPADPIVFSVGFSGDNVPDYVSSHIPLMSAQLYDAFVQAGVTNLQAFPTILNNEETGESWKDFVVVNVVGMIACADLDFSVASKSLGGYYFHELVIDPDKAGGELMYRLAESHSTILVHYDVAKTMFTSDNLPIFNLVQFTPIKTTQYLLKQKDRE
ncbi:MAG: hypothetical protein OCD76_23425 [Reichenbachiella sp.]